MYGNSGKNPGNTGLEQPVSVFDPGQTGKK